ncbi:MAG: non-canonical purine NTP pyrophosphatase, partial [Candidatus Diapherotrites archaeon]|nr:non-canonical purine NTP pyrophosphatase [Candidatus Diapherotrites archaeon]
KMKTFTGTLHGKLLSRPKKPNSPRLPYEKLIIPNGHTQALVEMTLGEKNKISHRAQATRKFGEWFAKNMH